MDVDGKIIQEVNLLNIDMENEEFIGEYSRVTEYGYLKHADGLLCYDDEEENYVNMGLRIRHDNEATA